MPTKFPAYCCFDAGALNGSTAFSDEIFNTRVFELNCDGTEDFILECENSRRGECGQFSDAHVICQGKYVSPFQCIMQ